MLRLPAVVLLLYISVAGLYAGEPLFVTHGADLAGMAYASVSSPGHWNNFQNQALMPYHADFSLGFSTESRFMMKEMSSEALSVFIPGRNAPLGLVLVHYGNGQYSTVFSGLASAVKFSDHLSLGIQVDFLYRREAGEYPDFRHVTFEVGIAARLSEKIMTGIHIFNPLYAVNSLPSSLRAGCTWYPADDLFLSFETAKTSGEPLSLHLGLSWNAAKKILLRAGYISSPSSLAFGTGYASKALLTDVGFILNQTTGITPSVSFIWTIGGK